MPRGEYSANARSVRRSSPAQGSHGILPGPAQHGAPLALRSGGSLQATQAGYIAVPAHHGGKSRLFQSAHWDRRFFQTHRNIPPQFPAPFHFGPPRPPPPPPPAHVINRPPVRR